MPARSAARPKAWASGGSGSTSMTRAPWPGTASFGGSRQSSTSAVAGRQGRSTAGGGAMSMPAWRARFQSSKAGRESGLAAMAR